MNHDITITPASGNNPHADRLYRVRCTCGLRPLMPMSREAAELYRDRHRKQTAMLRAVK